MCRAAHHVPVDQTDRMRGHGLTLGAVDQANRITKDAVVSWKWTRPTIWSTSQRSLSRSNLSPSTSIPRPSDSAGSDSNADQHSRLAQIVVLDDLVAVVGDHMWAAKCGLAALDITWNDGPNAEVSSELIWSRLRSASLRDGAVAKEVGDVKKALGSSGEASSEVVTAAFEMPMLAHACVEPLNCTVHVTPTSAEAWIGTQVMERVHVAVANAAGLPESQVTVHNHLLGGGFGRKLEPDMAYTAARIAKQVEGPVKLVWTREEDIRHDFYRPAYRDLLWARLEGDRIIGWKHRVSGSSVNARFLPTVFQKGVDPDGVASARDIPYDIPNLRVEFNREEPPGVNTGFWRGVGSNNNVFAIESFIEELAHKAGKDSVAFRRAHLDKTPPFASSARPRAREVRLEHTPAGARWPRRQRPAVVRQFHRHGRRGGGRRERRD